MSSGPVPRRVSPGRHEVIQYDQNQQVAQMCSIAAKPPTRTPPLPDSSSSKPKKRPREPMEQSPDEDSFLLRAANPDDPIHAKVVEVCRGMGYNMSRTRESE